MSASLAHLKGLDGGCILLATTLDFANHIVIVALAVVDIENADNWVWFLGHLKACIDAGRQRGNWGPAQVTNFVSDRSKGIINGCQVWGDAAVHFYCIRHMIAALKKRYTIGKDLRGAIYAAEMLKHGNNSSTIWN